MRTTYIFLFSICIALNSTECMTPKSHQQTKFSILPISLGIASCVGAYLLYKYVSTHKSRNDKDPNSITTLNFSNDCVPNTTMHFLSIPDDVMFDCIIAYLKAADQLQLRGTCNILYKKIPIPALSTLCLNLEINSFFELLRSGFSKKKLKDPRTIGIINLLEQNNLRIKNISFINTNQSGLSIFCTMLHVNTTLTNLNLDYTCDADAQCIANMLKGNTTLTKLSLKGNYIDHAGAQCIAESLKINTTLTNLNLRSNYIGIAGAQSIADMLKINTTLINLNLWNNNIGDARVQFLSESLKGNSTLTSLDLGRNNIRDAGAQCIAKMLTINKTLTKLDLRGNNIGDYGVQFLANMLKINTTITNLLI